LRNRINAQIFTQAEASQNREKCTNDKISQAVSGLNHLDLLVGSCKAEIAQVKAFTDAIKHVNFTELLAYTQLVLKNYNHQVSQLDKFKSYTDGIEQVSYKFKAYTDDIEQVSYKELIVEMKANIASNLKRIRSKQIFAKLINILS